MPAIEFSRTHSYLPAHDGISRPVILNNGAERVKLLAHADTGASHCLFERKHGELPNLDDAYDTGGALQPFALAAALVRAPRRGARFIIGAVSALRALRATAARLALSCGE